MLPSLAIKDMFEKTEKKIEHLDKETESISKKKLKI